MQNKAELIAEDLANANGVRKIWSGVLYNVKVYGAVGDWNDTTSTGTDDTAAVQKTVDTAIAAGSKSVFLPPGNYRVTALTNADQIVFFGDNARFNGIPNPVYQFGDVTPHGLFRQAGINFNFDRWQKGISFSGSGEYTADRWKYGQTATIGHTVSRQDGTWADGSQYCARIQRNPGDTGAGAMILDYSMESADAVKFRGKKVTVSFKARKGADYSGSGSILTLRVVTGTGVDESVSGYTGAANYDLNAVLSTDGQLFKITLPDVIADTVNEMGLRIIQSAAGTAGANDYTEFTQIQLCAGDNALPFQPRSSAEEELKTNRYRWQSWADSTTSPSVGSIQGVAVSANSMLCNVRYPVPMRVSPNVTIENNNVPNQLRNSTTGATVSAPLSGVGGANNKGFSILGFSGNLLTAGQYYDFDLTADAEFL